MRKEKDRQKSTNTRVFGKGKVLLIGLENNPYVVLGLPVLHCVKERNGKKNTTNKDPAKTGFRNYQYTQEAAPIIGDG